MKLFLAICWSLVMFCDIIVCVGGGSPTWIAVFCPLVVVVVNYWLDWITSRIDKSRKRDKSHHDLDW